MRRRWFHRRRLSRPGTLPYPERGRELGQGNTTSAEVTTAGRLRRIGPIEITRGCPFACGYCQTSHLLGMRPRHRSVAMIARYAGVIRQRGLRDVRVVAPDAFSYGSPDGRTLNLGALESLLAALRETLGSEGRLFFGTFPSEVRPEHVNQAALELVKRFADNDNLIIGAQSGSDKMLDRCGRGHSVADVFSAGIGLAGSATMAPGSGLESLRCVASSRTRPASTSRPCRRSTRRTATPPRPGRRRLPARKGTPCAPRPSNAGRPVCLRRRSRRTWPGSTTLCTRSIMTTLAT